MCSSGVETSVEARYRTIDRILTYARGLLAFSRRLLDLVCKISSETLGTHDERPRDTRILKRESRIAALVGRCSTLGGAYYPPLPPPDAASDFVQALRHAVHTQTLSRDAAASHALPRSHYEKQLFVFRSARLARARVSGEEGADDDADSYADTRVCAGPLQADRTALRFAPDNAEVMRLLETGLAPLATAHKLRTGNELLSRSFTRDGAFLSRFARAFLSLVVLLRTKIRLFSDFLQVILRRTSENIPRRAPRCARREPARVVVRLESKSVPFSGQCSGDRVDPTEDAFFIVASEPAHARSLCVKPCFKERERRGSLSRGLFLERASTL